MHEEKKNGERSLDFSLIHHREINKCHFYCSFFQLANMADMSVNGSVPVAANTVESGDKNANQVQALETDKERKERFCSLRIIYFTMFLISLGFSIVLTGIWPYLDKVCVAM